jgi:hypothetical protein
MGKANILVAGTEEQIAKLISQLNNNDYPDFRIVTEQDGGRKTFLQLNADDDDRAHTIRFTFSVADKYFMKKLTELVDGDPAKDCVVIASFSGASSTTGLWSYSNGEITRFF